MALGNPCKIYIFILFTIILALLTMPTNVNALPSNRVKSAVFDSYKTHEAVIVSLEKIPQIKKFILHNPERLVVDIDDTFVPQVSINKNINGKSIKKLRIGQNRKNTTRIVLDIKENLEYDFNVIATARLEKPAIIIEIFPTHHLKKPVINLSEKFFLHENKTISSPLLKTTENQDINNQRTEELIVLFDDSMPNDIFEKTDQKKKSDFVISGILQMRTSFQTKKNNIVENNISLRNRLLVETKYKKMVTLSAFSDYLYFGKEDKTDDYDLNLHEAKWQYTDKNFGFSLGRQIIRWGKTDQISPVDTINPQDMREFIIPDYEERKIPVWMADLNLFFDNVTLEGVFIPFFEESKLDYFQTNWSVFRHMKQELQNTSLSTALKTYFNNLQVHEKDPDNETEFGLRLSTTIKKFDLGVSFHHTTEDVPYFKSFPVKNINVNGDLSGANLTSVLGAAVLTSENIEVEYKRTNIAGFEFETTLADFGIRGEAAWQENESFLTSSLTSIRKPSIIYILGADYTTRNDTYLNLQFLHKHITNYDPKILYFDQNTYTLLGEISKDIISDWLEASLNFSKNLNNNEWYLSPQLKYTYITNLECIIGAGFFSGDKDTWLGSIKDHDILYFDVLYRF